MSQYHKKGIKHRHTKLIKGATKLVLNLAILAGFVMLIRHGYFLFFTHEIDPLTGSILFIAGIAAWVLLIKLLRSRYKWTKPSFKLTTFSVIAIVLILTFAGVQPLATYKDNFIESYKTAQAERAAERERAEAERTVEEEAERTEFDEVTDGLISPELVASYMKSNVSYDLEKYQRFLAGEHWGWDTPEEVFYGKKTNCGGYAILALYCLLKSGYEYDNFEKNKDNAAVMLGCWNSNIPNHRDVHTVLLYIKSGLFYTIDVDRIRGPFKSIEEAATASLPTWTVYYFYDIKPQITQTVERKVVVEQKKQTRVELMEVVDLVNDIRVSRGFNSLIWDSELYTYSKQHSEDMASQKRLFHTSMYEPYAENAWGGEGSTSWTASDIVESWMSSDFHRTWLLCPHLKRIAVGIAISDTGMYASWTFWRSETWDADWWYVNGTSPPDWWY